MMQFMVMAAKLCPKVRKKEERDVECMVCDVCDSLAALYSLLQPSTR